VGKASGPALPPRNPTSSCRELDVVPHSLRTPHGGCAAFVPVSISQATGRRFFDPYSATSRAACAHPHTIARASSTSVADAVPPCGRIYTGIPFRERWPSG
jgi:hypothetical protein